MQRHSVELGAFDDQHPGGQFILKDAVATFSAGHFHHPTCHFAKRISDSCDRASLCESRPANDSQPDTPARWSLLFRAFAHSIFSRPVVAAQGRRPDPKIGVALSFTDRSNPCDFPERFKGNCGHCRYGPVGRVPWNPKAVRSEPAIGRWLQDFLKCSIVSLVSSLLSFFVLCKFSGTSPFDFRRKC